MLCIAMEVEKPNGTILENQHPSELSVWLLLNQAHIMHENSGHSLITDVRIQSLITLTFAIFNMSGEKN